MIALHRAMLSSVGTKEFPSLKIKSNMGRIIFNQKFYVPKGLKMATVKTYDPRCYELASLFLSDVPDLNNEKAKHSLALEIQQVIEDEIHFMREGIFSE